MIENLGKFSKEKLLRRKHQAEEMAYLALHDNDTVDARRRFAEARKYTEELEARKLITNPDGEIGRHTRFKI